MGVRLQDVELVEDGDPSAADDAAPPASGRRRRRWPWVLGVLALAGALAAGQHVVDARHAAYVARFEHVPGVLPPLTRDPQPLWRLSADQWPDTGAGGFVVHTSVDARGAHVEALDPATGRAAWTRTVAVPGASDDDQPGAECRPTTPHDAAAARLVCLVSATQLGLQTEGGTPTDVLVLDARSGSTISRWRAPVEAWDVTGDRVLVATGTADGDARTWSVSSRDLHGRVAWTRTFRWTAAEVRADGVSAGYSIQGDDDWALLSADGHAALLDRDGTLTRRLDGDGMTGWTLGRAGLLVRQVMVPVPEAGDGAYTTRSSVELPDGGSGQDVVLGVDDGSAPGIAFTTGESGGVTAYDVHAQRRLWDEDVVSTPQILLGGVLYTESGFSIVALDARTGRTLWTRTTDGYGPIQFTDGHWLYVLAQDGALRTFALADGAPGPVRSTAALRLDDGSAFGASLVPWNGVLLLQSPTDGSATVVG